MSIKETAAMARQASLRLAAATTEQKNKALEAVRSALLANADAIIAANAVDMAQAKKDNLAAPLLKRLKFDQAKIDSVCEGIESLIRLDDPVGQTLTATELDAGLELYKVTCPIG
ncbi:MAG: glutamate-5-semialdehyde dehydrogenase, partial [Planctomycetota bacterium]